MVEHQIEEEIDLYLFIKYFYKKRRLIFLVLLLSIVISLVFSFASFMLKPPVYSYISQSVIDMTISEGAEYQKPMFLSYLGSEIVFEESAKSIGLDANYSLWRDSIIIESISGTSQIVLKISSTKAEKLVELNRRIVSNTIFQTSNILTGINTQTIEEAEILDKVQEIRGNIDFLANLLIFSIMGLMSIFGWLMITVITDRRIKRPKDIENISGLVVIGTIPDFNKLLVTEEINLSNFMRGLIWKKKK